MSFPPHTHTSSGKLSLFNWVWKAMEDESIFPLSGDHRGIHRQTKPRWALKRHRKWLWILDQHLSLSSINILKNPSIKLCSKFELFYFDPHRGTEKKKRVNRNSCQDELQQLNKQRNRKWPKVAAKYRADQPAAIAWSASFKAAHRKKEVEVFVCSKKKPKQ